jgi:hypothetical protein
MRWNSGFGPGSATLTANSIGGGAYLVTARMARRMDSPSLYCRVPSEGSGRLLDSNGVELYGSRFEF